MKILQTPAIQELDAYTIRHEPIASIDLMERAARALVRTLTDQFGPDVRPVVFAGPGNNGGDALAVARLLAEQHYRVTVYLFNPQGKLSPGCAANKARILVLHRIHFHEITDQFTPPPLTGEHLVIDGLFGSGLNKPLAGGFAAVVNYLNASSVRAVVSIDLPSGMKAEENNHTPWTHIVRADFTLSLQLPKLAFLFAENERYTGTWKLIDIGLSAEGIRQLPTPYELLEEPAMAALCRPRPRFAHKGHFGHALLVAGQQGMAGACILAARACLRSGVGLLSIHLPRGNNAIVQTAVPEAMTLLDEAERCFTSVPDTDAFRAVGVGPGIGRAPETAQALFRLIEQCPVPMVLDADALNILSEHHPLQLRFPAGTLFTPHPGELERLAGKCTDSYQRLQKTRELAARHGVHVLLKGAYSALVTPEGHCYFNPTGNPGMARAGSGDMLTGVVLALLAQGYPTQQAACLAMYVHGRAGDIACRRQGETGMTISDMIECLPEAWKL
ncbi:MAG: NAD(P)H-hydrate dehydratase [Prevotellaceae bacterium]|jgi:NAD(P)H-hydrate epimerase|nr:NAD(P)H-hydrate dehydratase [Prevotellaceae bacterium]